MHSLPPGIEPASEYSEAEIDGDKNPKRYPIAANFGKTSTHLIDANQAIDRRLARKNSANVAQCRRDGLDRPGNANQEKLRQSRRDKENDSRFPALETGASGLPHEACGQKERHREKAEIERPAKSREPIGARQDDEQEKCRR
jgi:hypothetical protein